MCPGLSGPGWDKGMGVIATKSTDMEGTVYAKAATQYYQIPRQLRATSPYWMIRVLSSSTYLQASHQLPK
jgi:hypothetical protein